MKNIWNELQTPFFVLAPMENVTDTVFRRILLECGRPDLFFTEFTNTDGMLSRGADYVTRRLIYTEPEKPLIAQIWGNDPNKYLEAAKKLVEMRFDGVDINMGCPVVASNQCIGLIHNRPLVKELIQAIKDGAQGQIPVSVKTRLGWNSIQTEDWISFLLEQDIAALTIHGRTKTEMSKVPAHWDEIGKAVEIRDKIAPQTKLVGNGDVSSYAEGLEKAKTYGVDGVMLGRGVFHNLWIFNKDVDPDTVPLKDKLTLLIKHIKLFEEVWAGKKPAEVLKKYYKVYVQGMENASEFRIELMDCKNSEETIRLLETKIASL